MAFNFRPNLPQQAATQAQQAIARPQQARPQLPPQAMAAPQTMASPQGNAFAYGQGGAMQGWQAQRPQFAPGMDPAQFKAQMMGWRDMRPMMGQMQPQMGQPKMDQPQMQDVAARHAAMLQQARPQAGFAPQGFQQMAPQAAQQRQPLQRKPGY